MQKFKIVMSFFAVVVLAGVLSGCILTQTKDQAIVVEENPQGTEEQVTEEVAKENNEVDESNSAVQEFEMESFTEIIDGQYFPQFSKKEITVNKGDKVRLKINATSGMHNIKIDEFNVLAETPIGEVTVVEFVANQAGEFVYYCAKPGHRALGQWGTLKVIE
ncbi:MAG: hypothetical protein A2406_04320 [Candidatus Komeilibacteria bacterium RIFOXYC1_FULL_37_11]|uniref:Blue (type 1) copper domain-containing protein n=1 Tax=Candidatus Komeilibacteria bacterium RIFOXYC1_FULL_37_11 TaxID=1798555 RepID=A0A1G2BZD0_9BACT|nr:MAG: hypothetical protein A2406_04320 [Candidatus Komeilibacteria bacterium RIFOXYC1_FULL_37_11]OGY95431.1 MAG: hypothetical protein A2611_01895 [Candidatus Komeilibacteria bacterium RIFOXYD1_FULL_37_29]